MMQQISNNINTDREIVWQINSSYPKAKPKNKKNNSNKEKAEPSLMKTLIEKTFSKISLELLDRLAKIEAEMEKLRKENTELKNKVIQASANATN